MTNRLLTSATVVLMMAGSTLAYAQNPSSSPGAQSAPSAGSGTAGGMSSERGTGGERGSSPAASERGSSGTAPMNREGASDRGSTTDSRAQTGTPADQNKGMANDSKSGTMNRNAEKDGPTTDRSKSGAPKSAEDTKSGDKSGDTNRTTTGQAGGGKMTSEQRTQVTSVIRETKVKPVTNINFSISVGTRVPREVHFNPLPARIVTIYPDWRGYQFFLVRDEIVIVDPATLEIVAVLPA